MSIPLERFRAAHIRFSPISHSMLCPKTFDRNAYHVIGFFEESHIPLRSVGVVLKISRGVVRSEAVPQVLKWSAGFSRLRINVG